MCPLPAAREPCPFRGAALALALSCTVANIYNVNFAKISAAFRLRFARGARGVGAFPRPSCVVYGSRRGARAARPRASRTMGVRDSYEMSRNCT